MKRCGFYIRVSTERQAKDVEAALAVLDALREHGDEKSVKRHFASTPPRWQAPELAGLEHPVVAEGLC